MFSLALIYKIIEDVIFFFLHNDIEIKFYKLHLSSKYQDLDFFNHRHKSFLLLKLLE
ncbi:uncharacterized protein BX663DRAFT_494068 [Cokeromyces recurvatus]|uniref:uncharacterized protein n=1 Tax=Cokeromyces recurvatus TaxID=90255 RepID=UPI002221282C|nr:uncharacterized protein BX663DRAFT_494068 [Cokeromyces recurvatus]KAI7906877.1 hypothetical protein BX663DRAFT_494068 [Cokeromyces recurvatus]